jgi:predicted nucleic acid-binding protein
MKIYLDTCSLQRPLDNKNQIRIILEAEAVLGVIGLCETGKVELVSSEVLFFEVRQNPKMIRREFGLEVLAKADAFVRLNEQIEKRAKEFTQLGIKPLDALHLASAEIGRADYFCTCDDKFLKKAKGIRGLKVRAISPVELIEEIEQ